jgi:hypothetical protein
VSASQYGNDYREADLGRRLEARRARDGERQRVLCLRCRKRLPEGKRAHAKYCSVACGNAFRYHARRDSKAALRKECRRAAWLARAPALCACGEPLSLSLRGAPPARRWRAKQREARP